MGNLANGLPEQLGEGAPIIQPFIGRKLSQDSL